ncbi:MAG: hypothetical protein PWR30_283 [Candidatus Woesearchaeota archaeon]|nr:hypothetical protein [Candidatus Woesearchaeota archaeon]
MAIEKKLSWIEILILIKEIKDIVENSRINKISARMDEKRIILNIKVHKPQIDRKNLCFLIPDCFFLSRKSPEMPTNPLRTTMILRKLIDGGFIRKIEQCGSERVIRIEIEAKEKYALFVEFIPPGNIILTNKDEEILFAHSNQEWKDRKIIKGEKYELPSNDDFRSIKIDEFLNEIKKQDSEVVIALAKWLRVGGDYAEEILYRVGIDKELKTREIDESILIKIYEEFRKMLMEDGAGYYYEEGLFPFQMRKFGDALKRYDSFNEALDELCFPSFEKKSKEEREAEKLIKIIEEQERRIKELEEERDKLLDKGNKIYEHYSEILEIMNREKSAGKRRIKINLDELKKSS